MKEESGLRSRAKILPEHAIDASFLPRRRGYPVESVGLHVGPPAAPAKRVTPVPMAPSSLALPQATSASAPAGGAAFSGLLDELLTSSWGTAALEAGQPEAGGGSPGQAPAIAGNAPAAPGRPHRKGGGPGRGEADGSEARANSQADSNTEGASASAASSLAIAVAAAWLPAAASPAQESAHAATGLEAAAQAAPTNTPRPQAAAPGVAHAGSADAWPAYAPPTLSLPAVAVSTQALPAAALPDGAEPIDALPANAVPNHDPTSGVPRLPAAEAAAASPAPADRLGALIEHLNLAAQLGRPSGAVAARRLAAAYEGDVPGLSLRLARVAPPAGGLAERLAAAAATPWPSAAPPAQAGAALVAEPPTGALPLDPVVALQAPPPALPVAPPAAPGTAPEAAGDSNADADADAGAAAPPARPHRPGTAMESPEPAAPKDAKSPRAASPAPAPGGHLESLRTLPPEAAIGAAATAPRAEPRPAAGPATAQPAPAIPDLAPEPPTPSAGQARDFAIRVAGGEQRIDLHVAERAGEVHVVLHTPDAGLAARLHQDLPELSGRLAQAGYHQESASLRGTGPEPRGGDASEARENGSRDGQPQRQPHQRPRDEQPEEEPRRGRTAQEEFARLVAALP